MTHATGGLSSSVSTRIATKPAASNASAIWPAAAAVVLAVAPGHRGCETITTSPPAWSRPASSSAGARARTTFPCCSRRGPCRTGGRRWVGRQSRQPLGTRGPHGSPPRCAAEPGRASPQTDRCRRPGRRVVRRAISRTATPGPNPISSTRSEGCTSMSDTAHALRFRFDGRSAISHPTRRPGSPRGFMN